MNITSTVLPDSFLRCLSPEDRKALGQKTAEEVMRDAKIKNHGQFQKMIYQLLRLKGIEPLVAPVGKKSGIRVGWPDVTFAVDIPGEEEFGAFAWELKIPPDKLSDDQQRMHIRLSTPPNCWRVRVIRSVDEALAELKELGL